MIPDILDLTIPENDSGETTVRGYLIKLLDTLWYEEESFNGKRPFGNSGWQYDLTEPLVEMGYAKNYNEARLMIHDAIRSLYDH